MDVEVVPDHRHRAGGILRGELFHECDQGGGDSEATRGAARKRARHVRTVRSVQPTRRALSGADTPSATAAL